MKSDESRPDKPSDAVAVPRRFLTDFINAINWHGGHGTPSIDRVQAISLSDEASVALDTGGVRTPPSAGVASEPTKEQRQALNDLFMTMCSKLARGEEINWLAMPHEVWRALKEAGGYVPVPQSAREESKLDKPAQVGNTIFGAGISERTVIERAQREHDYRQRPESEAVRISLSNNAFRNLHLEVALAELVELKGMKDALDDHHAGVNQLDDWYAIEQDYKLRKPRAWQRARELLAPGASLGPSATGGEHG